MHRISRQAGCIVFREVFSSYILPLGVWQVRENVRNAFSEKPMSFNSQQEALDFCWSRLNITSENWLRSSNILDFMTRQRKLEHFIS
jgi:hypothetical protein